MALAKKNCTMISKTIQNDLIVCMGSVIKDIIIDRIKTAQFYTLLLDETTDVSKSSQLTVCIQYVDVKDCKLQEDFVGFFTVKDATGEGLKLLLLSILKKSGLSLENLRGQGYDEGSNMSGRFEGLQALIHTDQPLAIYCHCYSHSLNLVLSKSCQMQPFLNMFGTVGGVC